MSSSKWFAHCVSPEISNYRRSSLNQLEILSQLSKISPSSVCNSPRVLSNYRSETDLTKIPVHPPRDFLAPCDPNRFESPLNLSPECNLRHPVNNLYSRRSSCGPTLMHMIQPVSTSR